MNEQDKHFIKRYEELLDKGYCDCNEMNCIDNNSPRRILNIVKDLQKQLEEYENMRKEIIEFINLYAGESNNFCLDYYDLMKLRNILNKVGEDNE